MGKNSIIAFLTIGIIVLVGCGTADVEEADSIEDIAGTWKRVSRSDPVMVDYIRFSNEGTYLFSDSLDKINDVSIPGFLIQGEYWFEDTQYFDTRILCTELGVEVGVYEILLLEHGNIKFELIEDECHQRKAHIIGAFSLEGKIEWEPVP